MKPESSSGHLGDLAPGFLIAMPQLLDPNFNRTVVLLLKSNEEGALGLVINRPTEMSLREFLKLESIQFDGDESLTVNLGGPVEQESHLLVLHGEPPVFDDDSEAEIELAPGLRLVMAMEGLRALAGRGTRRLRCYVGYAGWGPGQLERELSNGAWIPLPCDASFIFDQAPNEIWGNALRRSGIDPISLVPGGAVN